MPESKQTSYAPRLPACPASRTAQPLNTYRPSFYPLPLAQTHPRKLFSVCPTPNKGAPSARPLPLALIHPRNSPNARARSAEKSKTPARGQRYEDPLLAPPHPRKFCVVFQSPNKSGTAFRRPPLALIHPRKFCVVFQSPNTSGTAFRRPPPALIHPRKFCVVLKSPTAYGTAIRRPPLAPPHPRKFCVVFQSPNTSGTTFRRPPLALIHPRNSPNARARSAEKSKRLIYGSAIKTQRKPFENSNLQISNRR
jgi:hypothetical protein